jgi:hypothetical protein
VLPLAEIATVVAGLLLRLGLPLAVTAGAIWLLRRLDERWQAEADQTRTQEPVVPVERCWEVKHCPPEKVVGCRAYLDQSRPCWQQFREGDGRLQERCLACELFARAGVPTSTRPRVPHP